MDTMTPPFLFNPIIWILDVRQPIINSEGFFLLPCSLIPWFTPQDIQDPLFCHLSVFFVSSFDAADVIANISMETINRKSGQVTAKFSADNWKNTLYYMYFLEQGKDIGRSHIKLVGCWFPLLKVHICFEDIMCTWACWKRSWGVGGGGTARGG